MTEHESASQKRVVEELNFGSKTSKRVGWTAWEFSIERPHLVRVTNASYGYEKADHSYLVGIEARDGLLVPSECECPADKFNEEYDCKHKVALATIAGPLVLQTAVDCPNPEVNTERSNSSTLAERLRADGGVVSEDVTGDPPALDEVNPEECDCDDLPNDGLSCADCYIDGRKELPE